MVRWSVFLSEEVLTVVVFYHFEQVFGAPHLQTPSPLKERLTVLFDLGQRLICVNRSCLINQLIFACFKT